MDKKKFFKELKRGNLEGELFGISHFTEYFDSLNSEPSYKVYNYSKKDVLERVLESFESSHKFNARVVRNRKLGKYQMGIYYDGKVEKE